MSVRPGSRDAYELSPWRFRSQPCSWRVTPGGHGERRVADGRVRRGGGFPAVRTHLGDVQASSTIRSGGGRCVTGPDARCRRSPRAGHAVRSSCSGTLGNSRAPRPRPSPPTIGSASSPSERWHLPAQAAELERVSAALRPGAQNDDDLGHIRMPNADRLPRAVKLGDQARAHREPGAPTAVCALRPSPQLDTYGQPNFGGRLFLVTSVTPFLLYFSASVPPCFRSSVTLCCWYYSLRLLCLASSSILLLSIRPSHPMQ